MTRFGCPRCEIGLPTGGTSSEEGQSRYQDCYKAIYLKVRLLFIFGPFEEEFKGFMWFTGVGCWSV